MICFNKRLLITMTACILVFTAAVCLALPKKIAVSVVIDGETKEIETDGQTVADILALENIVLGPDDRTIPGLEEEYSGQVEVIRVEKKTVSEEKKVAYQVEKIPTADLYAGQERIQQKGVNGLEKQVYEVILENGAEVSRKIIEKVLVKKPVKQVVNVGTLQMVSRGGETIKFSKVYTMSATGYTHTGNMTYTDIWPTVGIVAVDPKVIPLRTRLYIENYGYATAMDKGSAIKGNRIDLFFETKAEALKWGRRKVQVFVLE